MPDRPIAICPLILEAARQSDLRVVPLPWPFVAPDEVLPDSLPGESAVYCGPIPQRPEHYADLEGALGKRGARLVNTAAASEQATRIKRWHERIGELTARTVILRGPADLPAAAALGFPVFVKGLVKSAKEPGLESTRTIRRLRSPFAPPSGSMRGCSRSISANSRTVAGA